MGLRRLPFISHFVVFAVKLNQELQATTRAPRAPAELQGRTRATRTPTELQATTRAPRAPAELQGRTRSSVQLTHCTFRESHLLQAMVECIYSSPHTPSPCYWSSGAPGQNQGYQGTSGAPGQKTYGTRYSQAVPHPSTDRARPGLASEIRRDRA